MDVSVGGEQDSYCTALAGGPEFRAGVDIARPDFLPRKTEAVAQGSCRYCCLRLDHGDELPGGGRFTAMVRSQKNTVGDERTGS